MDRKWKLGLFGAIVLSLGATACVDQQPSLLMMGSVLGDYQGGGACEYSMDMSNTGMLATQGFINLADLADGQLFSESDTRRTGPSTYYFTAQFQNKLVDSRNVGAQSSGGGGGGFQNMHNNQNDVMITSATVNFPASSNSWTVNSNTATFPDIERERLFSMLVQSGDTVAVSKIPIINGPREMRTFTDFLERNGIPDDEALTFMVEIQLHGKTMAGTKVESNRFEYPISICRDCGYISQPLCVGGGGSDEEEDDE